MSIANASWQPFSFAQLFTSSTGDTDILQDMLEDSGVPVVSAGESTEGVIGRTSVAAKVFSPNTITLDMFGQAFAHGYEYKMVTHARVQSLAIKGHDPTIQECLFIATIINFNKYKFAYGRMCNWERIKDEYLLLPAIKDERTDITTPDWQTMSELMAELEEKENQGKGSLANALQTKNDENVNPVSTDDWGEFSVEKLFGRIEVGKANAGMLDDGDDCLYLGAKKDDNCVMQRCARNPDLVQPGNCIVFICNGEGSVGYANYMDREFIATTDLVMGYAGKLNKYNGLFITTILDRERPKYSFGRKWKTHLRDTIIKLPKTKDGKPDWDEMERRIKVLPYGDRI